MLPPDSGGPPVRDRAVSWSSERACRDIRAAPGGHEHGTCAGLRRYRHRQRLRRPCRLTSVTVNFSHDGACVLLAGGPIAGLAGPERFSWKKKHPGYARSIWITFLGQFGVGLQSIHYVLLCNPHYMGRLIFRIHTDRA